MDIDSKEVLKGRIEEYKKTVVSQEREIDNLSADLANKRGLIKLHEKYRNMIEKLIDKLGDYE